MTEPDPQYVNLLGQLNAALAAGDPTDPLVEQLHARYLQLVRGGQTAGGLPYPDPTDPLAEGADAIRALAEAIDARIPYGIDLDGAATLPNLPANAWSPIGGWTANTPAGHNPISYSTGTITIPAAGDYLFSIALRFTGDATNQLVRLSRNGANPRWGMSGERGAVLTTMYTLDAGDTILIEGYTSDAAMGLEKNATGNWAKVRSLTIEGTTP